MSEDMRIEGKPYISSKRASELTGYAQDYIGQLARKTLIDARRIGGLWYISMESLQSYKKKADEFKPEPPARVQKQQEPGTLIFFDGKEYLSAGRAAEQTGYTQDYVGQLARAGTILSKQVGNRWYVERSGILSHKAEKDRLLGAVQTQSVGLLKKSAEGEISEPENTTYASEPLLNYFSDPGDLMPAMVIQNKSDIQQNTGISVSRDNPSPTENTQLIAIRRLTEKNRAVTTPVKTQAPRSQKLMLPAHKTYLAPLIVGAAATIVIVLSAGYVSLLKQNSVYAVNLQQNEEVTSLTASVDSAFSAIGDILEPLLTRQLNYQRPDSQ